MEGGILAACAFETNGAAMLIDDHGTRDGESLARALAHRFGGEKGIEHFLPDLFRDPGAGVADANFRPGFHAAGAHRDRALALAAIPHHVGDGVRGVDDQVILNLVINASHAIADVVGDASRGKGTIAVSTRRLDPWVEIRIRDTGGGIPENIKDKIFDPFFTTKPVGKRTGQGLAIARSVIMDKHGGTIHFESETGRGTTFVVRLPLSLKKTNMNGKP